MASETAHGDLLADCIERAYECVRTHEHYSLTGGGMFDNYVLFTELFKFLQALGKQAGYSIESVYDVKEALRSGQLTKKDVQTAYTHATGKVLDFGQISSKVGRTMQILELVAQDNYKMYQRLVYVADKYLEGINSARRKTRDEEFRVLLDDLHRDFEAVQRYIQFISQRQLKASYVPPATDYTYDDYEKYLFTALHKLQRVLKYCFASDRVLASKFVSKIKQYAGHFDKQVYLFRLIHKTPLVLSSTQFSPSQIVDAFERAYEQIDKISAKAEKDQYVASLFKITQKILSEKMTDRLEPEFIPQHRSIYQTLTHEAVVKDQRINVFKHRVNHFYILIIKQFVQILDKKYYQDLAKMSQDLQLAVYELSEMQRELIDETESDINRIIDLLKQEKSITQMEYSNTLFRLKAVSEELERQAKNLSGPFAGVVNKITDLFQHMIRFLDKTVKKGLQYSADDLLDVEHYGLDSLTDDVIRQQNEYNKEWFAFITNYLTVFHMRYNLARVKRELATIDEKTYYAKTTYRQLQQIYNECDKFYQQIDDFYTKSSGDKQLKCDPTLAKYLYHVALRFQSSMFISKGRSTHPAINPRYYVFSYFAAKKDNKGPIDDGKTSIYEVDADAKDFVLDIFAKYLQVPGKNDGSRDFEDIFYYSYRAWTVSSKFVGVTEELAAHKCKYDQMSIPDNNFHLPKSAESFKRLEDKIDGSDNFQNTLYKNLSKHPFIHNVLSGNYVQAKMFLQSLIHYLHYSTKLENMKAGEAGKEVTPLISTDLGIDEFKYMFLMPSISVALNPGTNGSSPQYDKNKRKNILASRVNKTILKNYLTIYDFIENCIGMLGPALASYEYTGGKLYEKPGVTSWYEYCIDILSYIFTKFGSDYSYFCKIAHGTGVPAPNYKEIFKNVNVMASREEIANYLYKAFTDAVLADPAASAIDKSKFVPFSEWKSIRYIMKETGKDLTDIKYINEFVNSLDGGLLSTLSAKDESLRLLAALMYFPIFVYYDDGTGGNVFVYRFGGYNDLINYSVVAYGKIDYTGVVAVDVVDVLIKEKDEYIHRSIYQHMQEASPSLISYFMGMYQDYGYGSLELLKKLVYVMEDYSKEEDAEKYVSCMSDENLKEYLMPYIQLPFINSSLHDSFVPNMYLESHETIPCLMYDNDTYGQVLYAQYGRRMNIKQYNNIISGSSYECKFQEGKRLLFDSMPDCKYSLGGKMPITPMFGSYLFMPIMYQEKRQGQLMNKKEEVIKNAYIVRREYDSFVNCFFDYAIRSTARDYNTDLSKLVFANKRNAVYFAVDQSDNVYDNQIDRQSEIFKNPLNAFFEYQLFMAQQLQYFTATGCKFVFDPLVRKYIFEVANKIYRGLPLFKYDSTTVYGYDLNKLYEDLGTAIGKLTLANLADPANNYLMHVYYKSQYGENLALSELLGPFKDYPSLVRIISNMFNQTDANGEMVFLVSEDRMRNFLTYVASKLYSEHIFRDTVTRYFGQVGEVGKPKGFYPISDEYIYNYPRLSLGVVLKETEKEDGMQMRQKLIDACIAKDSYIVQGDVLKVNYYQFEKLLAVLREAENKGDGKQFRVYLSECIRQQYHANALVLEKTEPILATVSEKEYSLEQFQTLLKRVLRIKRKGYKALLQLAEQVDKMLSVELKSSVSSNIKFSDLRAMLDKLMLHSRTQQEAHKLKDNVLSQCMNVNQYLSIYGKQNPFNSVYRQKNKLLGKGVHFKTNGLYRYDLAEYYQAIEQYLNDIEKEIRQDDNIENFAKLFTHIYQHSDDEYVKKINHDEIRKFMVYYLVSSAIDVDASVLETDFSIEQLKAPTGISRSSLLHKMEYDDKLVEQEISQFEFKMNQKMQLIGIDAIFVPQNWHISSQNEQTTLVPRQANQCTQELDFLYNNIVNSMAQKLINTLTLYRLSKYSKKKEDEAILLPRILLGSGKRRGRSASRGHLLKDVGSLVVTDKKDFDSRRIELYYRTYLLCYYYYKFFNEEESRQSHDEHVLSSPVLLILKPNNEYPEGDLLRFLFNLFKKGTTSHVLNLNLQQINELIAKIDAVAGRSDSSESYINVFNKIVEYVNTNYGIVSVREKKYYEKLIKDIDSNENRFSVYEVYDRMRGIPEPEDSNSLLRVAEDESDPVPYIDAQQIKKYLDEKIQKFSELLKKHHNKKIEDFSAETYTLSRVFRNLRLEFKTASRDQKVNKVRHLIAGQISGFRGDFSVPLQIHERIMFGLNILHYIHALGFTFYHNLNNISHDSIEDVLLQAQLASIFNQNDLIDLFPQSNKPEYDQLNFSFRYDFTNFLHVVERVGLMIKNTIKKNKKLTSDIYILFKGSPIKLTEADQHIDHLIADIKKKFTAVEPLTDKEIEEYQKYYDSLHTSYFDKNIDATKNVIANNDKSLLYHQEFILPDNREIISTDKKGLAKPPSVPDHWESVSNDKIIKHSLPYLGSQYSVLPTSPAAAAAAAGPASSSAAIDKKDLPFYKTPPQVGAITLTAAKTGTIIFFNYIASLNDHVHSIGAYYTLDMWDNTTAAKYITSVYLKFAKNIGEKQLKHYLYVKACRRVHYGKIITAIYIHKDSLFKNSDFIGYNLYVNVLNDDWVIISNKGFYGGIKGGNALDEAAKNGYKIKGATDKTIERYIGMVYKGTKYNVLPIQIYKIFDEKFVNRELVGGNNSTYQLGLDYEVYKIYDYHENYVFKFNKIIKYLIKQTSVIAYVPKAFASMFYGIWTGPGSQSDHSVIVKYRYQHVEDYKADPKLRNDVRYSVSETFQPTIRYRVNNAVAKDKSLVSLIKEFIATPLQIINKQNVFAYDHMYEKDIKSRYPEVYYLMPNFMYKYEDIKDNDCFKVFKEIRDVIDGGGDSLNFVNEVRKTFILKYLNECKKDPYISLYYYIKDPAKILELVMETINKLKAQPGKAIPINPNLYLNKPYPVAKFFFESLSLTHDLIYSVYYVSLAGRYKDDAKKERDANHTSCQWPPEECESYFYFFYDTHETSLTKTSTGYKNKTKIPADFWKYVFDPQVYDNNFFGQKLIDLNNPSVPHILYMKIQNLVSDYKYNIYMSRVDEGYTHIYYFLDRKISYKGYYEEQELVYGLLYDSKYTGLYLYSYYEVEEHNDVLLSNISTLQTHFTSSVVHFAGNMLKEMHLLEGEKKELDAGKIPVLHHDTEVQIVSCGVYALMQLDLLLKYIEMQLHSLQNLNLYGIQQNIRNELLNKMNVNLSHLNSLKHTVYRFRDNLEKFVEKKKEMLQSLLCDTKNADAGLVSNLFKAIYMDNQAEYNTMEVIVYGKYLHERMQCDSKYIVHQFAKQFGQGIDVTLLNEVEPLIWMLIQCRHSLMLSSLDPNNKYKPHLETPNLPIQSLPEFNFNIYHTLPCRNYDVNRRIIEIITSGEDRQTSNIEDINMLDLGILPINLNMIKKDVGLFHIFFNSSMYSKYLSTLSLDDANMKAYPEKDLMGMKLQDMALIGANSFLRRHISKHLALLQEQKKEKSEDMMVLTKQDQFRYEIHLRLAIAMYALANSMKPAEGESFSPLNTPQF